MHEVLKLRCLYNSFRNVDPFVNACLYRLGSDGSRSYSNRWGASGRIVKRNCVNELLSLLRYFKAISCNKYLFKGKSILHTCCVTRVRGCFKNDIHWLIYKVVSCFSLILMHDTWEHSKNGYSGIQIRWEQCKLLGTCLQNGQRVS